MDRKVTRTRYPGIFRVTGGKQDRFMVMYRLPGVGQRSKTLKTLNEARLFQARMRDPVEAIRHRDLQKGKVRLNEYFWTWLDRKRNLSETTRSRYEGVGRLYICSPNARLGHQFVSDVRREDVEQWISWLVDQGVGRATIDKAYRTLRACLAGAVREGKAVANSATSIDVPRMREREPFFLSAPQVDAVANCVGARDRALVYFLAYTGVRMGEATALRVRNLDLVGGSALISESSPELRGRKLQDLATKNGRARSVHLPPPLVRELAVHLERFGFRDDDDKLDGHSFVFTGDRGRQVRQNNWRSRVFQPACRKAGVTRVGQDGSPEVPRVHDLRHTAASLAAASGFSLHEVKQMLGHSTIKTTSDRYLHLFHEEQKIKASQLGELMIAAQGERAVVAIRPSSQK